MALPIFDVDWRQRKARRVAVFERDQGICAHCGLDTKTLPEVRWGKAIRAPWNTDLIVPVADDGTVELANLRTLCLSCDKGRPRGRVEDSFDL